MEKNYRIIASMSDYDSSRHADFNNKPLLRKIGSTEYRIWSDGFWSLEKALDEFRNWAAEEGIWYDDEEIAQIVKEESEANEVEFTVEDWKAANRWYEGKGYYDPAGHERLWDGESLRYHDDIWTFEIEEA